MFDLAEKTCARCSSPKLVGEFVKSRASTGGRGSWCKPCFNTYVLVRIQERQRILNQVKARPCADCGRVLNPWCMDLDHVRGEKHNHVSELMTSSLERFWEEVSKCEVVCACCHRVRTKKGIVAKNIKFIGFQERLAALKSNPCLDCGSRFPPEAMDFDHVRGEKSRNVSTMHESAWATVLVEIRKCDLVCAVCHRERTHQKAVAPNA